MTPEVFFEKFETFADTTNAVAKMRELILQLAASGRLVSQSPSDETAEELSKKIARLFTELRQEKVIKGEPIEPFDEVGLPELPSSWKWVRLGNVVDYGSAEKIESDKIAADAWLLDLEDIEKDSSRVTSRKVFAEKPSKSTKTAFDVGDVLYGKLRPYLNKVLVADGPGYCTTEIVPIRTFGYIEPAYLCYALKRPDFIDYANSKSYGMNLPRLGTNDARKAPFPLPPLAEQKRIVAKVDELMALCDRLEAQQQEREQKHAALARASLARFADEPTTANLDFIFHSSYTITPAALRQSILTLGVQGRLVPQDPNDENSRDMIDRAIAKRKQAIRSKNLRRKKLDQSADLFRPEDLPSLWCVERLANLVDPENTISYGVLVPGPEVPDGIPFVRAQDLRLTDHPARPNKTIAPEIEQPYARTRLIGGEILLCVVGSIGKLGVVPDSWAGANIARAVARIKPIPDIFRDYLLIVLQEQAVQNYFTSTTRTLAQPTLNVGMIEQTRIPVPPFSEQCRIVAKVNQFMALVDQLEAQLAQSRKLGEKLMDALVAELTSLEAGHADSTRHLESGRHARTAAAEQAPQRTTARRHDRPRSAHSLQ